MAVTVGLNVLYVASLAVVARPSSGYDTWWDGWVFHVATTVPGWMAWRAARRDRRSPWAWRLVASGIGLNTVGNLLYTYHDQNRDPIPFPAWSDVGYLGSYVAFAVALVLITQQRSGPVSRAARLDGLVVGLSAGAVAVAWWFDHILAQTGSAGAVVVGLAYPLFDVVFIVIVMAGLAPVRFRPDRAATVFVAGIGALTVGDIVYLHQQASGTYVPGTWLEVTWLIGMLLFGLAAERADAGRAGPQAGGTLMTGLPVAAASAALGVIGIGTAAGVPLLAVYLAMAAIAAALARVAFTARELRRANDAFRQARTDDLTTLLNRRGFTDEMDRRLVAPDAAVGVLVVDLDGFKEVNDSLGHHAGDQLLAIVAERFVRAAPPGALVARLGGDEFGVAVTGPPTQTDAAAAALLATLHDPISLTDMAIRVGASIGQAHTHHHRNDRTELLRCADVAMYDAKANHLGRVWYDPANDPHSRDRLALIEELRTAIDHRTFDMHYQPTIDVVTGTVVGMEALIRWHHPTRGLLPPDQFIPLAERVGLIPAITRAVLDLAIAHLATVHRAGHHLRLSVNISAKDLVDDDLPRYIHTILDAHRIPPAALTLEITETALSIDTARAERTLTALRTQGVRISIDDFGVGYSSMSQLLNLPLDELKLDRSFIANLDTDLRACAILSATVELGRTLGLDVVAEGIETAATLDTIAARGVDTAQGYYLSRPLTASALATYLDTHRPATPAISHTNPTSAQNTPSTSPA